MPEDIIDTAITSQNHELSFSKSIVLCGDAECHNPSRHTADNNPTIKDG